jgi:hypothetical protein
MTNNDDLLSPLELDAFTVWCEHVAGIDIEIDAVTVRQFRDSYEGPITAVDFAWDVAGESMEKDSLGYRYFDAEKFARDLLLSGEFTETGGYLFTTTW